MSERSGSSHAPTRRVTEPNPLPTRLGVHPSGDGLDVAVIARGASSVDMCIFDEAGAETRFALLGPKTGVWHGHIPGYGAGTRYGFRAHVRGTRTAESSSTPASSCWIPTAEAWTASWT